MADSRPLLYDATAEQAALGAAMLYPSAREVVLSCLTGSDFGVPSHAAIYHAIRALHSNGVEPDATNVLDQLKRDGNPDPRLGSVVVELTTLACSPSGCSGYVKIVADYALRRRLAAEATTLLKSSYDLTEDAAATLGQHKETLAQVESPILTVAPGDETLDEYISRDDPPSRYVIPELLTDSDRVIIVAGEGSGKSMVLRQALVCIAHGIHPFNFSRIPPQPGLLIDLENPAPIVRGWLRHLTTVARLYSQDYADLSIWHWPGGINLRTRWDRTALEDVLRRRRPKVVALGPIYKSYQRSAKESDENAVAEVQAVLDDLRTRYGFALLMEHHAPHGFGGDRDLRPYGSSLWLRWPEYGLSLRPKRDKQGELLVGRWRGDRGEVRWPNELRRSTPWPWVGWWETGM